MGLNSCLARGATLPRILNYKTKQTMTRPEQPEPNHRFKTMQSLTTTSGNTFDYCIDSDEDCDVSSDIEASTQAMNDLFSYFNDIFTHKP